MYVLISWSTKNGVTLGREELEVRSTSKLTIMNGGKIDGTGSKEKNTFLVFEYSFVL